MVVVKLLPLQVRLPSLRMLRTLSFLETDAERVLWLPVLPMLSPGRLLTVPVVCFVEAEAERGRVEKAGEKGETDLMWMQ